MRQHNCIRQYAVEGLSLIPGWIAESVEIFAMWYLLVLFVAGALISLKNCIVLSLDVLSKPEVRYVGTVV